MSVRRPGVWLVCAFWTCWFGAACDGTDATRAPSSGVTAGGNGWTGGAGAAGGTAAMGGAGASGAIAGAGALGGTGGATDAGGAAGTGGGQPTSGSSATAGGTGTGGTSAPGGSPGTGGVPSVGGTGGAGGTRGDSGAADAAGEGGAGGAAGTRGDSGAAGAGGDSGGGAAGQPYKGVANSPAAELALLNAAWCYNWGTRPQQTDCADPLFVPMIWGAGDVAGAIAQIANDGYTTVLGFNEPNKEDQADMTVGEAIELWPDMTGNPAVRVGSPAVSADGRAWFEDFMDQVAANGLRVDFVTIHWYGWNAGSCDNADQLEGHIIWAEQFGRPIWLTEWGCMNASNPDAETVERFFVAALAMFENHPSLERYAWYPWNTHNHLTEGGALTPLGEAFAAAPAYR